MNLRFCVLALLLLWLSLTAVCGGECAPPARPRSPSRFPPAEARRPLGRSSYGSAAPGSQLTGRLPG